MAEADKKKKKPDPLFYRDAILRKQKKNTAVKGPSPLKMLQEVFEESPDKGRFVGDTMFWKYFEDIDLERVHHTNSVEYRNLWLMFHETLFFFALLLFFTVYVYNLQSRNVYEARQEQLDYWQGCDGITCAIHSVKDIASFWNWVRQDFVVLAFPNYAVSIAAVANLTKSFAANDFPITMSPRFVGPGGASILLGSVRMRQLRVKRNVGCTNSQLVKHVFPDCYPKYSAAVESQDTYSSKFAPYYLMSAFEWQDITETHQSQMRGQLNTYPGGGYMIDLPSNDTDTYTMMQDLYDWRWLDRNTRAIQFELTTLSTNVNVIVNTRIMFEFGPTGTVLSTVKANAAQVHFFTPSTDPGNPQTVYFLQILLTGFFLVQTSLTLYLLYKTCANFIGQSPVQFMKKLSCLGRMGFMVQTLVHYFGYAWNLCDLSILILFFAHFGFRLQAYQKKGDQEYLAPDIIGHPEHFAPFAPALESLASGQFVLSFLAVLMWVKPFKYLCMVSWFRMLTRIIERCVAKLFIFSVLLMIVIYGFAVAFFVGYGDQEQTFSTAYGTYLVMYFLLLDGYTLERSWFAAGKQQLMPLVFFSYIVVIYFVLLNVFIAVVVDTYAMNSVNSDAGKISPGTKVNFVGPSTDMKALQIESYYFGVVMEVHKDDTADVDFGSGRRGVVYVSDLKVPNPMVVFLWTYYNMLIGRSLVREENETNMRSEELSIRLEMLPGLVRRKWIEKKRKMQRIASDCFAGLELFQGEDYLKEDNTKSMTDWALPSSRLELEKMHNPPKLQPISIYDIPEQALKQEVSRKQLQRLMDEDETLKILLNSEYANEVIAKFKNVANPDAHMRAPVEVGQVRALQADVFGRMDNLETINVEDDVPSVPQIHAMTEDMSSAITDVRNQFRIQLTGIIEATASLFEHLVELTQGVDAVRGNHQDILRIVRENMGDDDD